MRLGVVLLCLALAACSPGSEGKIIAGRDEDGRIVAVLGICGSRTRVTLGVEVWPDQRGVEVPVLEQTRKFVEGDVGRIVLQPLPDHGGVRLFATVHVRKVRTSDGEGVDHFMAPAVLDLAAVPDLPPDADELARSYC